jgi:hypothetical protein
MKNMNFKSALIKNKLDIEKTAKELIEDVIQDSHFEIFQDQNDDNWLSLFVHKKTSNNVYISISYNYITPSGEQKKCDFVNLEIIYGWFGIDNYKQAALFGLKEFLKTIVKYFGLKTL